MMREALEISMRISKPSATAYRDDLATHIMRSMRRPKFRHSTMGMSWLSDRTDSLKTICRTRAADGVTN